MENKSYVTHAVEKQFEYGGMKVWVTVPTQADPRPLAIVASEPEAWPETPTVFQPVELVINFEVREGPEESPGSVVHYFSPPLLLRVEIPPGLEPEVRRKLKLAFWRDNRWVPFTKEKHHFQMHSHFATAVIQDWGDPTVAWGD
jgi:hypothetical protein